jgi:amidase
MAVPLPNAEQIREAAKEVGVVLTDEDVRFYIGLIAPHINAYNRFYVKYRG